MMAKVHFVPLESIQLGWSRLATRITLVSPLSVNKFNGIAKLVYVAQHSFDCPLTQHAKRINSNIILTFVL